MITHLRKNFTAAFTLIEIILALTIIGIVIGVTLGPVKSYMKTAKISATKQKMTTIEAMITQFKESENRLPSQLQELVDKGYLENEKQLKDAWEVPFIFNAPPAEYRSNFRQWELISYGPSGRPGGAGADKEIVRGE